MIAALKRARAAVEAGKQALAAGDEARAANCFRAGLQLVPTVLTADPQPPAPDTARVVADAAEALAPISCSQGRWQEGIAAFDLACSMLERIDEAPLRLADLHYRAGSALRAVGAAAAAVPHYRRSCELRLQLDPWDAETGRCLNNTGNLLRTLGKPTEALPLLERALEIDRHLDPRSVGTAVCLSNLASAYGDIGDLDA